MKLSKLVSITILIVALVLPAASAAVEPGTIQGVDATKVEAAPRPPRVTPSEAQYPDEPSTLLQAWQYGPATPFEWSRYDAAFVPGPEGEAWANKVYFMGGRTGLAAPSPAHDNSIWVMDPVTGVYTNTGYLMPVNISNYTANVIFDDGTARGPAIYIIGGYNADAAANHGVVQRFYPQVGIVEQLPTADDWVATVGGYQVGAPGVAVVDDIIYVFGGWESNAAPYFYDGTWAFDPTQPSGSRWTNLGITINPPRSYIQVAVQNGMIYAMGGIYIYTSAPELDPTDVVEVLDTANLAAGWQTRSPMPVAGAEGRGFGFDADTRLMQVPGHVYTVGSADWSAGSAEAMEYLTGPDTWNQAFPDLNEDRRDHAGVYVPLITEDPNDGLPGMWVFGGRWDSGDAPPFAPTEFYPLPVLECDVLLVDDDWDQYSGEPYNGTGTAYYTSTLDALGYNYDRWDVWTQGDPTLADMQGYEAVVWFTGYAWEETVTPTNEIDLAAYLDGGGNLFLTAYDYLYDQGLTTFGSNYLGIDSYVEDTGEVDPIGTAGDPIGGGLGPYSLILPTSWPSGTTSIDYADYVYPQLGAATPFYFQVSTEENSTRYDGSIWRTVYLGWPLEGLANLSDRADVLGNALSWLCEPRSGVFLLPNFQEQFVDQGDTVTYVLEVSNQTENGDTFDLTYSGNIWPTTVPAAVGPIAAGASMTFSVEVQVPITAVVPFGDLLVVTATSQINPNMLDDATIRTQTVAAVDGHIYDANTGLPLAGYVTIYDNDNPSIGWEAWANADGYYSLKELDFALRSYDMYAAKIGYDRVDTTLTFTGAQTTTVDFWLPGALVEVDPATLEINALENTARTVQLGIINHGSADLLFRIDEVAPGTEVWPMGASPAKSLGVDAKVYEALDASIDGTAEVLVVMAEQADLSAAYDISDWEARGQYVYNVLKATADRTQASVRKYLQENGIEYQTFLSVNALGLRTSKSTIEALAAMPEVQAIEPATTFQIPEPIVEETVNAPDAIPWNLANIGADKVWSEIGVTGEGIIVANIDTGVEYTHTALVEQYRGNLGGGVFDHNYNWWDPRNACEIAGFPAGEPCDNDGHGTHTMGSMVGNDNPTEPISATNAIGVAPGAEWIACKGCEYVEGWPCSTFALLECADFIVAPWDSTGASPDPAMRPHIVNNSWGGSPDDGWYFNDALSAWRAAGIFPAFSGGNSGPDCGTSHSPGDYYNSFATGGVENDDEIYYYSSRGPATNTGIQKPQVTAPGVSVRSSVPGNNYAHYTGTSMASPHTAGEVALIWSAQPELVGQVWATERLVEQTAMEIFDDQCGPGERPNYVFGWGRIDAHKAVTVALGYDWDVNWLAVEPNMGTVPAGDHLDVDVTVDTTGLTVGECYTAALNVETNDLEQGLLAMVPVELCIVEYDLFLSKTAEPMHQLPGMPVTYTIVFGNNGPMEAEGVTLLDDLPADVSFVSADPPAEYLTATHQVVWADLTIAAGATITATIVVHVDAEIAAPATLMNLATLVPELTEPITATIEHYVDAPFHYYYLPLIFKNYTP
ncbi:MAG: S8 family serine peptidase [Anaerolineae bacterium]|nr:S8 family serine peptidase [Anaerolineae bacterium]